MGICKFCREEIPNDADDSAGFCPEPDDDCWHRWCEVSETEIMNAIRLAVGSLPDVRLWRNNVGALLDSRGVPVHYGLAKGSGDLIGIVGPHGRFISIEVKRPGGHTDKARRERQERWREIVTAFGGVAGQVESVEEALDLVAKAREVNHG